MTTWLDDLTARDTKRDETLDDTWQDEAAELWLTVFPGQPEWAVTDLQRVEELKQAVFGG
jgi:hypothetical protein